MSRKFELVEQALRWVDKFGPRAGPTTMQRFSRIEKAKQPHHHGYGSCLTLLMVFSSGHAANLHMSQT